MRVQDRPRWRASAVVRVRQLRRRRRRGARAVASRGSYPSNCRLLDPGEAALTGAATDGSALLVLGFESADHPLDAWLDRALELCARPRRRADGRRHRGPGDERAHRRRGRLAQRVRARRRTCATRWSRPGVITETFETAITWDRFDAFVAGVRARADGGAAGGVRRRQRHLPLHARLPRRAGAVLHLPRARAGAAPSSSSGTRSRRAASDAVIAARRDDHAPPRGRARPPAVVRPAAAGRRSRRRCARAKRALDPRGDPQSRRADRPMSRVHTLHDQARLERIDRGRLRRLRARAHRYGRARRGRPAAHVRPRVHRRPELLNPEQLLVAAASSCQLLSFLAPPRGPGSTCSSTRTTPRARWTSRSRRRGCSGSSLRSRAGIAAGGSRAATERRVQHRSRRDPKRTSAACLGLTSRGHRAVDDELQEHDRQQSPLMRDAGVSRAAATCTPKLASEHSDRRRRSTSACTNGLILSPHGCPRPKARARARRPRPARASGGCGSRCRGPACRTATRGRSRRAAASCCSTPASAGRAALAQLERALDQAGLRLEHVRLLVCTHAHSDHYGLAGPIVDAAGCELWMHPNHAAHDARAPRIRTRMLDRRIEVARSAAACPRTRCGATRVAPRRGHRRRRGSSMPDRDLLPGRRGRDRPRHVAGVRDARPRALARHPPPARPRRC